MKNKSARGEQIERRRKNNRAWYRRVMADPDRYARHAEKRRAYYEAHKEWFIAYSREWRHKNRERTAIQRRLQNDRRRMRCRESAEYYQHHLAIQRLVAYRRRAKLGITSMYVPRMNRRIPFGCTLGKAIDARSVFLWNNRSSCELIAALDYKKKEAAR